MSTPTPNAPTPQDPQDSASAPTLPPKRRGRGPLVAAIVGVVVIVLAVVAVIWVKASNKTSPAASQTVRIGVVDASQPYWKTYTNLAQQRLGITVKLVNFTDYSQPNPALSQGELELNQFQHIQYLANYNVTSGDDLQPIGSTAVYPLPLYSLKYHAVSELPADGAVAIPNDAINEARGLLVLQSAGLIELKDGGSAFSTTKDITSAKVKVTPLNASQTATVLKNGSAVAAVVNNDYATPAGLKTSDVLYKDDPSSSSAAPYVNIFVARAADKDNATYLKLVDLYHDPEVEAQVKEDNGGTAVLRNVSATDLQTLLATVEKQAKEAGK